MRAIFSRSPVGRGGMTASEWINLTETRFRIRPSGHNRNSAVPPQPSSITPVEIDLSPFSLGRRRAWATGVAVFAGVLVWFFVLIAIAVSGAMGLAVALGLLTFGLIIVMFVITMVQRMSRSSAGQKCAFLKPEDAARTIAPFPLSVGEIIAALDSILGADRATAAQEEAKAEMARPSRRLH